MDMNMMSAATAMDRGPLHPGTRSLRTNPRPLRRGQRNCRQTLRGLLRTEFEISAEKWLFFLLAVAALIGITYGFSCFIDLVQNWAAMERGISNLI